MTKSIIISSIEEKRQLRENGTEIKRSENNLLEKQMDYNYDEMKGKFDEKIEQEMITEIKYTEVKEQEDFEDSLNTIWRKKEDINCTIAEMRNISKSMNIFSNNDREHPYLTEINVTRTSIFFIIFWNS